MSPEDPPSNGVIQMFCVLDVGVLGAIVDNNKNSRPNKIKIKS